jgi:carbamoyl-phosphate synthase (ammonia)
MNKLNKLNRRGLSRGLEASLQTRLKSSLLKPQNSTKDSEPRRAAILHLKQSGLKIPCTSFGSHTPVSGEVVFATGMVGYPESLTDPSYTGQILTLTSPMVGNYGVPRRDVYDDHGLPKGFEGSKIHASGLLCQEYSSHYSHWNAGSSLGDWLKEENTPGLTGIDTRMLTKLIREQGALTGRIEIQGEADTFDTTPFHDPMGDHLVSKVSCTESKVYGAGNPVKIVALDCGMKYNIIRQLCNKGAEVTVVPYNFDVSEVMAEYDGLFLSNGPGDPKLCVESIESLSKVLAFQGEDVKPIFGICLGNQLMGLASGAQTEKLPFGNRGQNQPVINNFNGDAYITPQNHGYAINDSSLSDGWKPLFTNANDQSNEGIISTTKPYFSAQFHPEATNSTPIRCGRSPARKSTQDRHALQTETQQHKRAERQRFGWHAEHCHRHQPLPFGAAR